MSQGRRRQKNAYRHRAGDDLGRHFRRCQRPMSSARRRTSKRDGCKRKERPQQQAPRHGQFANAYQGKDTERNLNRSRMRKLREKRHIEGRGSRSWRLVARSGDGRSPAKSLYVQKNMKYPQSREFKSPRTDLITVYVSHLPRQFCWRPRPRRHGREPPPRHFGCLSGIYPAAPSGCGK